MLPPPKSMIVELTDFMEAEYRRFTTRDLNIFLSVFRNVATYIRFLDIIDLRIKEVYDTLKPLLEESLSGMQDEEERTVADDLRRQELDAAIHSLCVRGHLEVESLYLFAKIYLDRLVYSIKFYFGEAPGIAFKSHGKFMEKLAKYVAAKNLILPVEFEQVAKELRPVNDFRDRQIAHEDDPQTGRGGVQCTPNGLVMLFGRYMPGPNDTHLLPSLPAGEVFKRLAAYQTVALQLLKTNRDKTALTLES